MEEFIQFESGFAPDSPIEDPRGHSPEVVERLRLALASGAPAIPEARRPGFFEVHADEHVFYIHISPVTQPHHPARHLVLRAGIGRRSFGVTCSVFVDCIPPFSSAASPPRVFDATILHQSRQTN